MKKHKINWLIFLNNKGEVENPANPDSSQASDNLPDPEQIQQQAPDAFSSFVQKKGFKSNDDVVKSYENVEAEFHRTKNTFDTTRKQLEAAGYSVNEKGEIIQVGNPAYQPQQPQGPYQQDAEPIYDPYSGQPITDPIARQLAQMPIGQREAFLFNAMMDQRERLNAGAFQAEQEILSKPEAKGFEKDVKAVMMQVPIQQRSTKEAWERALYEVKGRRYDQDRQNWGKQGAEDLINKESIQSLPAAPGSGVSVKLTPQQEQTYKWYQENHPGMFKDKAHFINATKPDGGR